MCEFICNRLKGFFVLFCINKINFEFLLFLLINYNKISYPNADISITKKKERKQNH
jgi:hypothetical protein